MFDVDLVERFAQRVDDREQSACIDIRNPAGDDDGVLVSGNEAPCQMLRQHIDCFNVLTSGLPGWMSERRNVSRDQTLPTPACLSRMDWTSAITARVSGA